MIKVKKRKILLLPGDGIGPEIIDEVQKIIEWFNKNKSLDFEIDQDLAGGVLMINMELQLLMKYFIKRLKVKLLFLELLEDLNGII